MIDYTTPGGQRNSDGYDTFLIQKTGIPDLPTRHFGWVTHSTKDFVISYLNNRGGKKIADLEFFVHSNKYAFLFDYSCDILGVSTCYLHCVDLRRIHRGLFTKNAHVQSWGCHTAEYMSGVWKKATGVGLLGAVGKTDYRAIGDNVSLPTIAGSWKQ